MAPTSISLLLLRNLFPKNPNLRHKITLIRTCLPNGGTIKLFSTSQPSLPNHPDPKTSLSARMSFVFDQMEAVQKERTNKDDALQRIRSWRESKKEKNEEESEKLGFKEESKDLSLGSNVDKDLENLDVKEVEVVHPWPEWIEFMERLVQQNYFDHRRNDEERMIKDLAIDTSGFEVEKEDFSRDWFRVRTACLNFGRDRFDILRSLSRQDIQILVGHGCPNLDKRVVSSAKLLRKYVHVDEGDVRITLAIGSFLCLQSSI
ncbi:hypothetical protein GIB67_019846 [Kingdonia uniflora]|uniref:Uncharacterized protein n=1 Tax=Kingdonia uniflora TaxID=39325 RepID=A0A7J7MKL4_9MAGN|nr:hypothetical protein GIB67_019846 [Kingdonia uniflora]